MGFIHKTSSKHLLFISQKIKTLTIPIPKIAILILSTIINFVSMSPGRLKDKSTKKCLNSYFRSSDLSSLIKSFCETEVIPMSIVRLPSISAPI
jgi:hypothetical protein